MNRRNSLLPLAPVVALLAVAGCDRQSSDSVSKAASTGQAATGTEEAKAETPDERGGTDDDAGSEKDDAESVEGAAVRRPTPQAAPDAAEELASASLEPDVTAARRDHTTQLWVGGLSEQDGETRAAVDVRELGIFEFDGLEDLLGMRTAGPAPYETGALPEPFDDLERVDVLTDDGPVELAIEQVRPHSYGPEPGDQTFWLRTEPSEKLDEDLGQYTLLAPAGTMDDEATYRTVDGRPPESEIVPTLREAILGRLDAEQRTKLERDFPPKGLEPQQEERLGAGETMGDVLGDEYSREFDGEHFTVVDGEFPSPHDLFVAVNGPEGHGGVHNQRFPIVRMSLFTRADGTVTEVRYQGFGPSHAMGHPARATVTPIAAADPDGDGTEGLIVRHDDEVNWLDFGSQ